MALALLLPSLYSSSPAANRKCPNSRATVGLVLQLHLEKPRCEINRLRTKRAARQESPSLGCQPLTFVSQITATVGLVLQLQLSGGNLQVLEYKAPSLPAH